MNRHSGRIGPPKPRRLCALAAALGLAAVVSGCVVYPAYYGSPHYYHHDWR